MRDEQASTIYEGKLLQVYARDQIAVLIMNRLYSRGGHRAKAHAKAYRGVAGNPRRGVIDYRSLDLAQGRGVDVFVNGEHVARLYQHSDEHTGSIARYIQDWAIQTKLRGEALDEQRKWTRGGWIRIEEVDDFTDLPVLA